jgi:uncharacterized protein (TIGR00290 family)
MDSKKKITVSWSGGKDSAFALYKVLLSGEYDVVHLHTVISQETRRVGLHGVHESLIDLQAESMGIPLKKIYLESSEQHDAYEKLMHAFYKQCAREGTGAIVFGDIFLEDLKKYREQLLQDSKLNPIFPLWNIDSGRLIEDFVNAGFRTLICSANATLFKKEQVGQTIDAVFLQSLPPQVDPCGENGEFHTFVYEGPLFKRKIDVSLGEVIQRSYLYRKQNEDGSLTELESAFWFQDLLPRTKS